MNSNILKFAGVASAALLLLVFFGVRAAIAKRFNTGGLPPEALQRTVISKDGTAISYEQTGHGPSLILISAALTDRGGNRPLAKELASAFTVLNYDRRGRGSSGNTAPYAVEREIEDIAALANISPGPVYLLGSSSGAVLALDAANRLGSRVARVFLYEPPFIVDKSRAPLSGALLSEIEAALRANDRVEAVALFFNKGMGIPRPGVLFMRLMLPSWPEMLNLAHTVPYDLKILSGTQSGKPLSRDRWCCVNAPTMVAVGGKSELFFHTGAKSLVELIPAATYTSLDGLDHSAVLMAPQAVGRAAIQFLTGD
jgi:pimeloyl-ACP methyl ester carboxylesterase